MTEPKHPLPAIRACIFDMDGLLLNTEDIYTLCANTVLTKYNRPPLSWSIKAQLMGVPGSSNGDAFHSWAKLPISRAQFKEEQSEQQRVNFAECAPLPGVEDLLTHLTTARNRDGHPVEMALASSSERVNYERKVVRSAARRVMGLIPEERKVLGDDVRVDSGRGKPRGDIYLVALGVINEGLREGLDRILPGECLVFEDSVPGVEAGRRAGMQVVWVPHAGLAAEYIGREAEVLAGRTGLVEIGDEEELGELDDGWGYQLGSLEGFPYEKFGIGGP